MKKYILLLVFLAASMPLHASGATTIICDYTSYSDEKGNHSVCEKGFKLTFIVDGKENVAYLTANQGTTKVHAFPTKEIGITFLEVTESANVMTTTVDGQRNSVHSRNTMILDEIVPSQYYGKCVIR